MPFLSKRSPIHTSSLGIKFKTSAFGFFAGELGPIKDYSRTAGPYLGDRLMSLVG